MPQLDFFFLKIESSLYSEPQHVLTQTPIFSQQWVKYEHYYPACMYVLSPLLAPSVWDAFFSPSLCGWHARYSFSNETFPQHLSWGTRPLYRVSDL